MLLGNNTIKEMDVDNSPKTDNQDKAQSEANNIVTIEVYDVK